MNIGVGIFAFNVLRYGRLELLRRTVESIRAEADKVILIDNGSTDGTAAVVEDMGGVAVAYIDGITTCGRGMNTILGVVGNYADCDIIVCSNDDIFWRPGWAATLRRVWSFAPQNVVLISGYMQPVYQWDQPIRMLNFGGIAVVERTSATGGAWTLRRRHLPLVGKVSEKHGVDDVPKARQLRREGYKVAAVDVADHIGEASSTWQKWKLGGDIQKWITSMTTK